MADNLDSGAHALATRAPLEIRYQADLDAEMRWFMAEVERYAIEQVNSPAPQLSLAAVVAIWALLVERMEKKLPAWSQLLATLRTSELPSLAFSAISAQITEALSLGLEPTLIHARITTALGLAQHPVPGLGGQYGRLLLEPNGESVRSWQGDSDTMARTAATADFGESMLEQLRAEGYTHKRWMTRYDSRVRESHGNVDRTTILLDEQFMVGGCALRYPADPMAADLSEVINCRCVLVGVKYGQHELDHAPGTTPWNNPRPA